MNISSYRVRSNMDLDIQLMNLSGNSTLHCLNLNAYSSMNTLESISESSHGKIIELTKKACYKCIFQSKTILFDIYTTKPTNDLRISS